MMACGMCCGVEYVVIRGMHWGLACIENDMHYGMDDESVDVGTLSGDCTGRPPGAYEMWIWVRWW